MYIYNVGYDTYEESEHVQLYHKNKFSNREFKEKVKTAVVNILNKTKIKDKEKISFQSIFDEVIEELVKNFGFKEVKFDAEFGVFGWADILDKEDWKDVRGEELNELTDFVCTKLKRKAK